MEIYLIRHGCTRGNLEHRYVGSTDESLTEEAVRVIAKSRDSYPHPDIVFSSPLNRCVETAGLLYPDLGITVLQELRKCSFGEFEYKNYLELKDDLRYQQWIDSGGTLPFPGGESREAFIDRCAWAFEEGIRAGVQKKCEKMAFVVHGGTVMAVLDRYSLPHRDYFDWQVKNGCGFAGRLVMEEGQIRITELRGFPE